MHVLQKRLVSHMLQDSMYFLCDENFPYFLGEMGKMIGSLADVYGSFLSLLFIVSPHNFE